MARPREAPAEALEFKFRSEALSHWIRRLRTEANLSLRHLELLSGVTDSEIFRIESGVSDCRLDAFVSICAALGVPAGWVIDTLSSSNPAWFHQQVLNDPDFKQLAARLSLEEGSSTSYVATHLSTCCVWAAILIRSSAAGRRARSVDYPTEELKAAFLDFAQRLDAEDYFLERAGLLQSLKRSPVAELRNQRLLSEKFCAAIRDNLKLPRAKRIDTGWAPYVPKAEALLTKKNR